MGEVKVVATVLDFSTKDVLSYLSGCEWVNKTIHPSTLVNWRDALCTIEGVDLMFGELLERRGTRELIEYYELKHMKLFLIYSFQAKRYPRSAARVIKLTEQFIRMNRQLITDNNYTLEQLKDELRRTATS